MLAKNIFCDKISVGVFWYNQYDIMVIGGYSCSFKTIDVIPTEKKDEYIERHTPVVEKADPDVLDEDDYEDPDFDFDDFDYSYEEDETADEGEE